MSALIYWMVRSPLFPAAYRINAALNQIVDTVRSLPNFLDWMFNGHNE